ncbi:MAG: GNAT family N-acetyltransferase, partial [Proteobacteria bacterium]
MQNTPPQIRRAEVADAEKIIELATSVFATSQYMATEAEEFKVTVDEESKWIESFRSSNTKLLLVAIRDDRLIGMLDFASYRGGRRSHGGVLAMSVHHQHRRQGVGKALLKALVDWAHNETTLERLELTVIAGNTPALNLYRGLGFEEEG